MSEDQVVRRFYESYGWELGESGHYRDAEAFIDLRPVLDGYHRRRDNRLRRLLRTDGVLVDLGCGAAPFRVDSARQVCLDVTMAALHGARQVLADRADYLRADVSRLPFAANSVRRVLCAHVLYHLSRETQLAAIEEIHRILAPGGVAVIVYTRPSAPLHDYLTRRASRPVNGRAGRAPNPPPRRRSRRAVPPLLPLPFNPIDYRELARALHGRMRFELRVWSLLETDVTRVAIPADWRGRTLLAVASFVERVFPRRSLRFGRYPMLVIRK